MKKILIIFSLLLLSGCTTSIEDTDIIKELHLNSNFTYPLTSSISDDIKSYFTVIPGFGEQTLVESSFDFETDNLTDFASEHETTYYKLGGYPDVLDEAVVVSITTTDPNIEVYGYSVSDLIEEASFISEFVKLDFSYDNTLQDHGIYRFCFDDVTLSFYTEDNMIIQIRVGLTSTNEEGVIF